MDLDAYSYPHIAYYDFDNGDLKYAYWDMGGWHIWTLDNQGDSGSYCSLALDSQDHAHISYHDVTNATLRYVYLEGLNWHYQRVDRTALGQTGEYTSIALTASDLPRIAYHFHYLSDGYLMYAMAYQGVFLPAVYK